MILVQDKVLYVYCGELMSPPSSRPQQQCWAQNLLFYFHFVCQDNFYQHDRLSFLHKKTALGARAVN